MPAPSSYTEAELAEYMHRELGSAATALGFVAASSYDDAVDETLLAYGAADIGAATLIRKLRAIARREAWAMASARASGHFNFTSGDQEFSRAQLRKMCADNYDRAWADVIRGGWDDAYRVAIDSVDYAAHDPYDERLPLDERAL